MLISHKHKFIFTKTVKTASTSVEAYFERLCLDSTKLDCSANTQIAEFRDQYVSDKIIIGFRGERHNRIKNNPEWYHHMSAKEIKNKVGTNIWENYFKFCTIRNPYEKILSSFFHFFVARNNLTHLAKKELIILFRKWLKKENNIIIDRDQYFIDSIFAMNDVIRYENLQYDIERICVFLNLPFLPGKIPNFKRGYRNKDTNILEYYDSISEEIVYFKYKKEFNLFSYDRIRL